jgi:cyclic-di-GMP-binding protein
MADNFSFDVVSKINLQHLSESIAVALKEIGNRYDFRGSDTRIEFDEKAMQLTLTTADDYKLRSVWEILTMRMAKQAIPLKNFELKEPEHALGGAVRQLVKITQGIPTEKSREIVATVKRSGLKVQVAIQADQCRVSSPKKDLLQEAIALLKSKDFGVTLQFTNYR